MPIDDHTLSVWGVESFDPGDVQRVVTAASIGLAVEPRPALGIGETERQVVLGWAFRPVEPIGGAVYAF